jgi:thiol-disulfide isomerase/thioredoxin
MRKPMGVVLVVLGTAGIGLVAREGAAQQRGIVARAEAPLAAQRFEEVLRTALEALKRAGSYSVEVDSQWQAADGRHGPPGGGHYRLQWHQGKYRVEVRSQQAEGAELVAVCDGRHVLTYFPARQLFSRHPVDSPQADLAANTMLAQSLQGSALDILLRSDVAGFVRSQAEGVQDRGRVLVGQQPAQHFQLLWQGARVDLYFAAEGVPLLLQFVRTIQVPTAAKETYEQVATARFRWQLGVVPSGDWLEVPLPPTAREVREIYAALAGEEAQGHVGTTLPKLVLWRLDGQETELAAAADHQATVLIFWAIWCAESVDNLPAVSQLVAAYQRRGVRFYAINVGDPPGEVRRFLSRSPLVSTVLLDPRGQSSSALRLPRLPAVAIVRPDNTLRAICHGSPQQLQADLTAHLEALLAEQPANTAQRPAGPSTQPK